jgi:hypothetical protein
MRKWEGIWFNFFFFFFSKIPFPIALLKSSNAHLIIASNAHRSIPANACPHIARHGAPTHPPTHSICRAERRSLGREPRSRAEAQKKP